MKLAIVCQRYDPSAGAGRFVARTLPALERAGFEPTLIAREAEGWGARRLVRVDPFHVGKAWGERSFGDAARKAWQREAFDLVQSHEPIPGCHVYRPEEGVELSGLKETIEHPRLRAVLCPSKRVRDELRRAYRIAPEKLHVLYGGVDLEEFHPRERERLRGLARAELGCRPRDTVFLALDGNAAAAMAAAADEAFWLVVAAGTPTKQRSKRVHFVEPSEDLRPLYAAADCLLLPGAYDRALEALAMGLPTIVAARSDAAELIEPGVNGWLCEPEHGAGLALAMKAADAAVAGGTVHAAARASAERFGVDAMASQLAAIYASL